MKLRSIADFDKALSKVKAAKNGKDIELIISENSTCCLLKGSKEVAAALEAELRKHKLNDKVVVRHSGCLGFCEIEPMVIVAPQNILYQKVTPQDAAEIVSRTLLNGEIVEKLLYVDPLSGKAKQNRSEMPFYQKQERVILGANERIEPTRIEDYLSIGGYTALVKVLGMSPEQVIEELASSQLRGRGGGGFPTGRKWASCRSAESPDGIR